MSKSDRHVIPRSDGTWSVRQSGASKASKVFGNQRDAIEYARHTAKNASVELYIHGRDGSIRSKNSYSTGGDPRPKNRNK